MPPCSTTTSVSTPVLRTSRLLFLCACLAVPIHSFAATYWVSPTGAAAWANCTGETPLSGTAACPLSTANANLAPGDTVYLRGGTYDTHIYPAQSGSSVNARIVYRGYSNEVVEIRNTTTSYATYYHGILLRARHYIWIDRVRVNNPVGLVPGAKDRPLMITHGSSYNELSNCEIDGNGSGIVQMWDGDIVGGDPVTQNWVHHCYIHDTGALAWNGSYVDDEGGMQLGVPAYDDISGNNTFEDNEFSCGGHHSLETFTKRNVIRNNFFHHEGCMVNATGYNPTYGPDINGLWGNRNLQVYDGLNADGMFNLIEGNRFGPSGPPPEDDGGDGLTITAPKNIVRYNDIYGSQNNGLLMKMGAGSSSHSNRIYNNTIFRAGRYKNSGPQWQGAGVRFYPSLTTSSGNIFKNNLIYSAGSADILHAAQDGGTANKNTLQNNWCTSTGLAGQASACIGFGDPRFLSSSMSVFTPTKLAPDLRLQVDSPAVDVGTHLTTTVGSGAISTMLLVADGLYFQDGSWGSVLAGHLADWIAIGTPGNVVRIGAIDYSSNTITLAQPTTWSSGDRVWLYQKSDGIRVLYGRGPDCGAHEVGGPAAPGSVRIVR